MEIVTRVIAKNGNGSVVAGDVNIYDSDDEVVKRVIITESEALQALQDSVDEFRENYVSNDSLTTVLENNGESVSINATQIRGLESDEIALKSEIPTTFDPISHDSENGRYGLGSASRYGHVKTRNDLDSPIYTTGEALSAYQGKVLKGKIASLENVMNSASNDKILGSGTITANKNNVTGELLYTAVDFGSRIGVFIVARRIYFTGGTQSTSQYYDISTQLIPERYRPTDYREAQHVCIGMGGDPAAIMITSTGRVQFRRLTSLKANAVYTHFHYFTEK